MSAFSMYIDERWIADGYIKKDNPDPANRDGYPYLVKYDCACEMTIGDETTHYASVYDAILLFVFVYYFFKYAA